MCKSYHLWVALAFAGCSWIANSASHAGDAWNAYTAAALPGATEEETTQLLEATGTLNVRESPPDLLLPSLNQLLNAHPSNRPGRLLRAKALIRMGDLAVAKEDVEYLRTHTIWGATNVSVAWARAAGDRQAELHEYQGWVKGSFTDPDTLARIAALRGDLPKAEKIYRDADNATSPPGFYKLLLGELLLQEGDYLRGIAAFQTALKELPKNNVSLRATVAKANLNVGLANWAMGQRSEALAAVLQVAEGLMGDEDYASKPEFLANVLLALHHLKSAGVGAVEQRSRADELFEKGKRLIDRGANYSTDRALCIVSAGGNHQGYNAEVRKILSKAPGLDWARWSALYLALDDPEHGQELLRLLPEKSIQRRIAEVELRAAQTQPATP